MRSEFSCRRRVLRFIRDACQVQKRGGGTPATTSLPDLDILNYSVLFSVAAGIVMCT